MKSKLLLILSFVLIPCMIFAQCIPNGDLENWSSTPFANNVEGWDTPNALGNALGVPEQAVFQETTNVQSGSSAAKLVNQFVTIPLVGVSIDVPGVLTTGTIGLNLATLEPSISGGAACNERPDAVQAYLQYEPVGGDSAYVNVMFLKGTPPDQVLVGEAEMFLTTAMTSYELVSVDVNWLTSDDPDTLLLSYSTSNSSNEDYAGSTLYVDNISFPGGSVGVEDLGLGIRPSLYPNPASTELNVLNPFNNNVMFEVYNIIGRLVETVEMTPDMNRINTSDYHNGLYLYRMLDQKGKELVSGKFKVIK